MDFHLISSCCASSITGEKTIEKNNIYLDREILLQLGSCQILELLNVAKYQWVVARRQFVMSTAAPDLAQQIIEAPVGLQQ